MLHSKQLFALLFLLGLGFLWSHGVQAQTFDPTSNKCVLNGSTRISAISGCQEPITQLWQFPWPYGIVHPIFPEPATGWISFVWTIDDAAKASFSNYYTMMYPQPAMQQVFCQGWCMITGITATYRPPQDNFDKTIHIKDRYTYTNGGENTISIALYPICPTHTYPIKDGTYNSPEMYYFCAPDASVKQINLPEASDITNTEGQCPTCNPVSLGTLNKQDDVTDLVNHSPYPIVWSRHWNGRMKQWYFNYDRKLSGVSNITSQGSSLSTATLSMQRQDGQVFDFIGTKNGTTWTWTPNLGNTTFNAMFLGKLTSDTNLTTFTLINHVD